MTFVASTLKITEGFEMIVYPNPFADLIMFEFDVNKDAEVLLELFNIAGIKIATVLDGRLTADHYKLEYLPENMSDGVLIYRLSFDGQEMVIGKIIHKK